MTAIKTVKGVLKYHKKFWRSLSAFSESIGED